MKKAKENAGESSPAGMRIKAERQRLGLTQGKMAAMLGISPSYLGAIERGTREVSRNLLDRFHDRLGFSYEYLLEGNRSPALSSLDHVREPLSYRTKRDISLLIGTCTEEEAQNCCSLIRTYLIHSRKQSTDGVRKKRNHAAGYLPAE